MSSTHMKMMIALRRVSTPKTPMVKSTAEMNRATSTTGGSLRLGRALDPAGHRRRVVDAVLPPLADDDGAADGDEEQDARQLEGEELLAEEGRGDGAHGVPCRELLRRELGPHEEAARHRAPPRAPHRAEHRQHRERHEAAGQHAAAAPRVL